MKNVTFSMQIVTSNDSCQTEEDVRLCLARVSTMMDGRTAPMNGKVIDTNGNSIGLWSLTIRDDE